jgi:RHH-type proline utilization regulon transcriptional repressor/proline dehydrogenase/delta 1-pyrroline-5-carboxylate dehydrogenase
MDYPVFTRRIHTDVSYLACARRLLAAPDAAFPQFATHNALTLATIHAMAGENFYAGQYEFQCLHGMGEPLYDEVVGPDRLNRPCRIYAPVGTHETLLAYLVRRLLENGANTSFVNQIANPEVTLDTLLRDPVEQALALQPVGAPHPRIALPRDLLGARKNSRGLDLANEQVLAGLAATLQEGQPVIAVPVLADGPRKGETQPVTNPADRRDVVGTVVEATPELVDSACLQARPWQETPAERAATLRRAADLMEARLEPLLGPIVREAGKTLGNAIGEVREAVDFLRYYADCVNGFSNDTHRPLGVVACISPWNFPLSIFTGQVAGALSAGNAVIAKPAEETPLIASLAVALMHEAGVPRASLQLLPGDGKVGGRLVGNAAVAGVVFTGSTEVAQSINRQLAQRLNADGRPPVLIAETGGQNAMIADSSALPEQLVLDALTSAFDSAGQRCSALRVLCLQDDIADRVMPMLKGAMAELGLGNPDRLSVDVGPVISEGAQKGLNGHIERMRAAGHAVHQMALPREAHGTFVPPTLIEIDSVSDLPGEVFGPVLHVLRYRREDMEAVVHAVNATGFGLTFGVQSRIDETIERATAASAAGNQYVNRNMIGAVVGVQPFGGHGLSGTGPKAGGPLYVHRLLAQRPSMSVAAGELPGPVGERNTYGERPKGTILCIARDAAEHAAQQAAAKAMGNRVTDDPAAPHIVAALFAGSPEDLRALNQRLAARDGAIVPVYVAPYPVEFLGAEVSLSVNTAAAGGNASLMTIG